jgi:hypothetical protein
VTPASIAGDSLLARPTTATSETSSRPRLIIAVRLLGGSRFPSRSSSTPSRTAAARRLELHDVVAHRSDQQRQPYDAVAGDHHGGEDRVSGQRRGLRSPEAVMLRSAPLR